VLRLQGQQGQLLSWHNRRVVSPLSVEGTAPLTPPDPPCLRPPCFWGLAGGSFEGGVSRCTGGHRLHPPLADRSVTGGVTQSPEGVEMGGPAAIFCTGSGSGPAGHLTNEVYIDGRRFGWGSCAGRSRRVQVLLTQHLGRPRHVLRERCPGAFKTPDVSGLLRVGPALEAVQQPGSIHRRDYDCSLVETST